MDHLLFKVSLHMILLIYMYRNLPFTGVHTFMVMLFIKRKSLSYMQGQEVKNIINL